MPLRIGHRGAAGTHPENTMVSFLRAVELGCDGVEFDVHRTSDGHLVVIHDFHVDRTTSGKGFVRDLTLEQLRQADAGSWKGEQFKGETVPTLADLIRSTPESFFLWLELKAGSMHYPGIEEDLVRLLKAERAWGRVQISSFDHHALKRLNELAPDLPLGMLYGENLLDPVGMAKAIGCEALHPSGYWVSPQLVAAAHAAGLKVNVWTINPPEQIAMMKHCGVDGIMSDFPDRI